MTSHRSRAPLLAAFGLAAGLTASAAASSVASAQQVEVITFFTSYYAVSKVVDVNQGGESAAQQQTNAPGLGVKAFVPVGSSFGLEGSVAYAWSGTNVDVDINDPDSGERIKGTAKLDGTLLYASGRVRYTPRRSNLYLLGGVGVVRRAGESWGEQGLLDGVPSSGKQLTNVMGVVGAGIRAQVTPSFGLDISAEVNLYNSDPDKTDGQIYDSKLQQDVLITIGMPLRLGRR